MQEVSTCLLIFKSVIATSNIKFMVYGLAARVPDPN